MGGCIKWGYVALYVDEPVTPVNFRGSFKATRETYFTIQLIPVAPLGPPATYTGKHSEKPSTFFSFLAYHLEALKTSVRWCCN